MKDTEGSVTSLTTSAERVLAGGHWLLPAAPEIEAGRADWKDTGSAWLRPGALFGAVIVPASLVHAALGLDDPIACAPPLAEGLEGGPVYYSPEGFGREGSYVALVPASVALSWSVRGCLSHPYRALLQVPAPDVIQPQEDGPWWVVPLDGPGLLCPPDRLAALVTLGREAKARTAEEADRNE
jgi:hypothetical protein